MKKTINRVEKYRRTKGALASTKAAGRNGAFDLPARMFGKTGEDMFVVVSDGSDWDVATMGPVKWEHVSASFPHRCPTWDEMRIVKDLFWDEGETVMQLHVPKSQHVNFHPHCLHLWKPVGQPLPVPPSLCVGPLRRERLR